MTVCLSFMTDTYRFMTLTKCGVLGLCRRCRTLHRSGWTLPGQWCVTTCRKHGAKDAQGSLYTRDPAYHTICPLSLTSQHVKHPHTMDAVTPSVHNEHRASQMACWRPADAVATPLACHTLLSAGPSTHPFLRAASLCRQLVHAAHHQRAASVGRGSRRLRAILSCLLGLQHILSYVLHHSAGSWCMQHTISVRLPWGVAADTSGQGVMKSTFTRRDQAS